jgi:hypothetical protein
MEHLRNGRVKPPSEKGALAGLPTALVFFLVLGLSVACQAQVVPVELLVLVCHSVDGTVSAK